MGNIGTKQNSRIAGRSLKVVGQGISLEGNIFTPHFTSLYTFNTLTIGKTARIDVPSYYNDSSLYIDGYSAKNEGQLISNNIIIDTIIYSDKLNDPIYID